MHATSKDLGFAIAIGTAAIVAASCGATPTPPPIAAGDGHLAGSSGALVANIDGGDFGETDRIDGQIAAGQFLSSRILLEGIAAYSSTEGEGALGQENEVSFVRAGIGGRYYFETAATTRPYLGLAGGMAGVDIDDGVGIVDDSDTAPFVEARLGMESFLTNSAAMDFGVAWQEILSVDLAGTEEDIRWLGAFVGLSIWL